MHARQGRVPVPAYAAWPPTGMGREGGPMGDAAMLASSRAVRRIRPLWFLATRGSPYVRQPIEAFCRLHSWVLSARP
jgi:hypothetical protein